MCASTEEEQLLESHNFRLDFIRRRGSLPGKGRFGVKRSIRHGYASCEIVTMLSLYGIYCAAIYSSTGRYSSIETPF